MSGPIFSKVVIVGLGLIGSSLARALTQFDLAADVVGVDADADVCDRAVELGIVSSSAPVFGEQVHAAELILICVPVGGYRGVAGDINTAVADGLLSANVIVSDVGSVKRTAIRDLRDVLPESARLVPGHPIAGTEQSGPDAGFAELFSRRWVILTPEADVDPQALDLVSQMWQRIGSDVEVMEPEHHDLVLAITSHVPHLIAYNIVGTASDLEDVTKSEVVKYSASGFRDFTRIAASDPVMWRDIFLSNRDAVLETLGRFTEDLTALQRAIRNGDGETLEALFTRTRAIRRGIIEAGQDTQAPNFGRDAPERHDSGLQPLGSEPEPALPEKK